MSRLPDPSCVCKRAERADVHVLTRGAVTCAHMHPHDHHGGPQKDAKRTHSRAVLASSGTYLARSCWDPGSACNVVFSGGAPNPMWLRSESIFWLNPSGAHRQGHGWASHPWLRSSAALETCVGVHTCSPCSGRFHVTVTPQHTTQPTVPPPFLRAPRPLCLQE